MLPTTRPGMLSGSMEPPAVPRLLTVRSYLFDVSTGIVHMYKAANILSRVERVRSLEHCTRQEARVDMIGGGKMSLKCQAQTAHARL